MLVWLFEPKCQDRGTLLELAEKADNPARWKDCHELFQRIRAKSLEAEQRDDLVRSAQYSFEEACAKTLYNLSGEPAPFDADSPLKIAPRAISLAQYLGIPTSAVGVGA
ncbi:hypothetical protein DWG18_02475 [Lysobacter sp. TY2-98]|uniref:hypothetical protein n=1 Tax=Lysobacter sp. TY2-98 TaxID=2290922 RepID=UPI000E1FB75E|nr:hypothetical protein [Lysobacter sp. TY2-98]AXK71265.1 hypothetical protein DWG18_02475 [Lysobacter sp. TY2-98]